MADSFMRLQKFLSECGVASRRKSEELISQGKVRINGRVAQIGDKINSKKDVVTVNGKKIVGSKDKYYIMLHKPRGFITTLSDEMGRRCVAELVKEIPERVYPVGRLDRDSEGLLLMTNDGDFANAMMHPKHHVPKTYRVTLRENVNEDMVQSLSSGIVIDGRKTAPADVRIILKEENRTVIEIVLYEGRNREIRKMCESLNLTVIRLKRTQYGSIKLGMLAQGKYRNLTPEEVHKLMTSSGVVTKKKW